MQKKGKIAVKKKGIIRMIIGCILIVLQLLGAVLGVRPFPEEYVPSAETFAYDIGFLSGFYAPFILGLILFLWGLYAYRHPQKQKRAAWLSSPKAAAPSPDAVVSTLDVIVPMSDAVVSSPDAVVSDDDAVVSNDDAVPPLAQPEIRFCNQCGRELGSSAPGCPACTPPAPKKPAFDAMTTWACVSVMIIALLIVGNIFQGVYAHGLKQDAAALQEETAVLQDRVDELEIEADANKQENDLAQENIRRLQNQLAAKQRTIDDLYDEVFDLRIERLDDAEKREFYDEYVALVDDWSKKYHRYGCDYFHASGFWVYSVKAAELRGYTACERCH